MCLRHVIPVFCIVSGRGSIDDHKVYQEVQGRRTIPLLQAYDYPYQVIDKPDEIERIPDAYEWHRLQKRPFVLFLTKTAARSEERMKTNEAMKVLAAHRGDAVVVCALGMAANEWWAVTKSEDSFYMHGGMGFASTFALGLALSVPDTPVWVINRDGALCMNTGACSTEAGQQPRNLKHFVVDNQCYQTVETMPMVNQDGADYTVMARGAGIARAVTIDNVPDLERKMPEIVVGAGPVFHPPAGRGRARLPARAAGDLRGAGDEVPLRPRAGEEARHQGVRAAGVLSRSTGMNSDPLSFRGTHRSRACPRSAFESAQVGYSRPGCAPSLRSGPGMTTDEFGALSPPLPHGILAVSSNSSIMLPSGS